MLQLKFQPFQNSQHFMVSSPKKIKICAGASAGGHMNQLLRLIDHSKTWPQRPEFYLTTLDVLAAKLEEKGSVYVIGECNRHHPLRALNTLIRCISIAFKERPDVVITTGAMPMALFCLVAKLSGARIVWIDSVANIDKLSMSGRLVLTFSDLFLTQWPELAEKYSKAEFAGSIL